MNPQKLAKESTQAHAAGSFETQEPTRRSKGPVRDRLEERLGINYEDLTTEEMAAVDRIKYACYELTPGQREGSHTDVIMDLSVAIAAELRRASEEAVREALKDLDREFPGRSDYAP